MVHVELHAPRRVARGTGNADRPRPVASMLVQTVFLVDATAAVRVAEVQPKSATQSVLQLY